MMFRKTKKTEDFGFPDPTSSTPAQIKRHFLKLCLQYHPDKIAQRGETVTPEHTARFQRLNAEYERLTKIAKGEAPATPPPSPPRAPGMADTTCFPFPKGPNVNFAKWTKTAYNGTKAQYTKWTTSSSKAYKEELKRQRELNEELRREIFEMEANLRRAKAEFQAKQAEMKQELKEKDRLYRESLSESRRQERRAQDAEESIHNIYLNMRKALDEPPSPPAPKRKPRSCTMPVKKSTTTRAKAKTTTRSKTTTKAKTATTTTRRTRRPRAPPPPTCPPPPF